MNNKEFLGTEKVSRLIIRLAIPTILAQIINVLYNIVDRIFIGHIKDIGTEALTGVGVAMPIIIVISAFASLIGSGGAPTASIYLGKKESEKAEIVVGNSFTLTILLGLLITVLFSIFKEPILYLVGASSETISYATSYLGIYLLGTIFVMITLVLNSFIVAQGFTKISMLSVFIGAILNIILDPIFIFGFGMGVEGAAIATMISQLVSCIFTVVFLTSKHAILKLKLKNLSINFSIILPAIAVGLSPFVMQFTEAAISVCFNISLKKYGGDIAIGTMTILSSLMQFAMLPIIGLAQGAQPVTSYNFGAGKLDRVKSSVTVLLVVSVAYSMFMWLLLMLMPGIFASIFTNNQELVAYAKWAIRIYFAVSGLFGIQIACQQSFVAIGNVLTSLFLAILRKVIVLIPMIFILPLVIDNNVLAVFLAEPIADGIAVTVTGIMFYNRFKKIFRNNNIFPSK